MDSLDEGKGTTLNKLEGSPQSPLRLVSCFFGFTNTLPALNFNFNL